VLTDYHVHLRTDETDASVAHYHTRENARAYREAASARGIAELGVAEHVYRFTQALELWRHPFWESYAHDDLDAYCEFVRERTDLRLGIECDYVPGAHERTAELLAARDFDFVVGSVHFITDGAVDMDDFSVWGAGQSPEAVWERYFRTIADAARSGLFDIIAHPDLVKYWGHARPLPQGDLRPYYELALEGIAESNVAVEVSTAGLRKPVRELYPSSDFLALCVDAGAPIALSSDAHRAQDVGADYDRALAALAAAGVDELCVFERRERRLLPIAPGETASSPAGANEGEGARR
jgi:histidinol-phosphatase (PHP family)